MSTYVIVDLETTGLSPRNSSIIEFAALLMEDGEIIDEFSTLISTYDDISPEITELTGITQKMVDSAPRMSAVRSQIKKILGDWTLVGHNVSFDVSFLQEEDLALGNPTIDTVALASVMLPNMARYRLGYLAEELNLAVPEGGQAHRALADTELTAELFLELLDRATKLDVAILSEIIEAGSRVNWPEAPFFEDALKIAAKQAFSGNNRPNLRNRAGLKDLYKPKKIKGQPIIPVEEPTEISDDIILGMFAEGGNFRQVFPDFEYREQQIDMVGAVISAFNNQSHSLIEAGTGTGKSVGYLLPAAFWAYQNGRRVVVSTNTINLQDQLVEKDIPTLQKVLPFEVRAAIRKGRSNYICTRIFQQWRQKGVSDTTEMALYARLLVWLPQTETGDRGELTLRGFDERMMWDKLNASNDVCSQDLCTQTRCPRYMAQRRADNAHIVIVNHALLLSDLANENHILPEFQDLIVDEAHHLEPAVTGGLSFEADKRVLERVVNDILRARGGLLEEVTGRTNIIPPNFRSGLDGIITNIRRAAESADRCVEDFFTTLSYFLSDKKSGRGDFAQQIRLVSAVRTEPLWDEVMRSWDNLNKPLHTIGKNIKRLAEAMIELNNEYEIDDIEMVVQSLATALRGLEENRSNIDSIIADPDEAHIYWAETHKDRLSLHAAPLHVGPLVEQFVFSEKETVVLTSATMQTAPAFGTQQPDFGYIRERLHAQHAVELSVGSPFNYRKNALLYLVTDMPEPNQPGYDRKVSQAIIDTAATLGGRTMVLFTSYRQLKETADAIREPLGQEGIEVLAQLQGSSRQQLTQRFKEPGARAVLLGTKSFWEGVDVPGEALQAVLLVKIPFDVPSDPVFSARSETFDNSFFEYSIPEAILRWRQGFGRLIRRQSDEGVVLILDKRVISKRYGSAFVESLPDCTTIRQPSTRINELLVRWFNRKR